MGFHRDIVRFISAFLANRSTFLSFNSFESAEFQLSHGLPQGSPLSPLLYLLYNNSLLEIPDNYAHSISLGFVNDVALLTAAPDVTELTQKVQVMADNQIQWAARHGTIFDTDKTKWMIFTPKAITETPKIQFGDREDLEPVHETRWLGVMVNENLNFKKHREAVLAKGLKRANFLTSLSNTRWGIPPNLFKILITATVHAATDYAVAAWHQLPLPKFYSTKLSVIDNIVARKALGALKSTPLVFLKHDLGLPSPEARLTGKILSFVARVAAKPFDHPLRAFFTHAKSTSPSYHRDPFHAFFQHPLAKEFGPFLDQAPLDPTTPFPSTPNFCTVIQRDKASALKGAKELIPSSGHVILFSDGSRIPTKNTAAAAWCLNSGHRAVQLLGPAAYHGIYKAKFLGFVMALRIAQRSITNLTHRVTVLLDNQGVSKEMRSPKSRLVSLHDKRTALTIIHHIHRAWPQVKVNLRWCPGHVGIKGNEIVDRLAKSRATKKLPPHHKDKPTFAGFKSAIHAWVRKTTSVFTPQEIKRLGHKPQPTKHFKALLGLPDKHSVASITQL